MKTNRKGFTLAELLIVVAIIAVLVGISIPIFNSQLKKARIATDQANVRSAKAAAAAEYMSDGESGEVYYLYDGSKAVKITDSSTVASVLSKSGYGKTDGKDNEYDSDTKTYKTGASGTPKNGYIEIKVDGSGGSEDQITPFWVSSISFSGKTLSTQTLQEQIEKSGLQDNDVVSFKASSNTELDSKQGTLANLFAAYPNLRVIDLSQATLKAGDMDLFKGVPETVTEIDLPSCNSPYNIRGTWYYADGSRASAEIKTSGADLEVDTRIKPEDTAHKGHKIYRNPPTK